MDNTQLKAFATYIVRDLMTKGVIAVNESAPNQWALNASLPGLTETTFQSKEAIVTKLADWYADHFAKQPGSRVA